MKIEKFKQLVHAEGEEFSEWITCLRSIEKAYKVYQMENERDLKKVIGYFMDDRQEYLSWNHERGGH